MSNNGAFDEGNKKGSTVDEVADGAEIRMAEAAMVEQQRQKPNEENIKADLVEFLNYIIDTSKIFLECRLFVRGTGLTTGKGSLLHGKPDLGPRVLKYLKLHLKDISVVFPRDLLNLSLSMCDNVFQRAECCDPGIVLPVGLEHAAAEVEQMIARKIKENCEAGGQLLVVGTTAILSGVSEKLRKSFAIIDIQELTDP